MKKQKIKLLSTLAVILILIIFGAIYFTTQNKYKNYHIRDLDSYKKINVDLDDGIGYYGTLNNYFDYNQDNLHSMYLFFDINEDIYRILGNIKIKSKTKKASESEKRFDIAYVPTYPDTRIMFQFHGDNIIIDGDEYKTSGTFTLYSLNGNAEPLVIENNPDEVRKYIEENK